MVKEKSKVILDYIGYTDAGEFDDGYNVEYTLGNYPILDKQLIGMKRNEEKDVDIVFPKDYNVAYLQGKPVTFRIRIKEIYNEN